MSVQVTVNVPAGGPRALRIAEVGRKNQFNHQRVGKNARKGGGGGLTLRDRVKERTPQATQRKKWEASEN